MHCVLLMAVQGVWPAAFHIFYTFCFKVMLIRAAATHPERSGPNCLIRANTLILMTRVSQKALLLMRSPPLSRVTFCTLEAMVREVFKLHKHLQMFINLFLCIRV